MCSVTVSCGSFVMLVVAGITYGIIMAIFGMGHHATPVIPPCSNATQNCTNGTISADFLKSSAKPILLEKALLVQNSSTFDNGSNAFPTPKSNVPPQCVDPTFACQDLQSAQKCGVVKECIHDIWSTMSVPDSPDNDEVCDICKEMVKEARDQLLSNMTQEEIKEVFEGSCKLLPIKLVADECIKVVDEIIPQLVEMLASRMDPTMVCTVSGMCFASHLPPDSAFHKFVKIIVTAMKENQCTECTTMMTDIKTFMNESTEAEDKKYLETICDQKMPSFVCNLVLGTYFPSLYTYVKNTDAKTLCTSAGVCPKVCKPQDFVRIDDELTCEFCDHLLKHFIDLITTNTTVEEFRTALMNFCHHTGSFSDKCTNLVNDYYDMLFAYIKKLDTKEMCTLMGLCNNEKCTQMPLVKLVPAVETRKRISMTKIMPAKQIAQTVMPLVKLVPLEVASKKHRDESNDIFQPLLPLEKFSHPLIIFEQGTDCAFCKVITYYIQQDLKGDQSKESVRAALDNVCDKWVKDYPDYCKTFLGKYSQKIQHSIAKGVEFDKLCVFSKACIDEDDKNTELNVGIIPKKLTDGPFCELCKDTMTEFENILSDPATKQKIEEFMDGICSSFGQLKDDCSAFFNSQVDALIDILQQECQPDNICPALKLCDASNRIQLPQRVRDIECDVCKDIVSSLRKKISDPEAKEDILSFLEEGCSKLPGSLAQECKTFVDENVDTLIGMIIEGLDPDTVCAMLKICPASLIKEKPEKINNIECELCQQVVAKVEDLISENKTENEIQAALDKVCSYLPKSWNKKCTQFVDKYTKTIITLFMAEMNPLMMCSVMNLCSSPVIVEKPKVKDLECDLCKEVIGKIEDLVKDHKTEAEIMAALDKVCSLLPSSWAGKCEKFVDTYTQTIITLLMEEMDADMICASLGVCPTKDLECEGCEYVFHYLQNQLSSNESQAKIKIMLKKGCAILPSSLRENCNAFIDEYGDAFLVLLAQELDPSQMCWQLQLCPKQVKNNPSSISILHPFNTHECSVCVTVVEYLDKLLEEDDVDKEITKLVEKVCTILPLSYRDKCSTLLETYGPYILQMMGQLSDSGKVCQEIDMCPRATGQVHLVGGNKCTFGPSYWCKSSAHASACKAESFCKEKVWLN